jgi:hypothetical protein
MPTVLTDAESGDLIPGLWGMRVYVGHWMLSPNYESKIKEIKAAGLEASVTQEPMRLETAVNFNHLLNKVNPEYVMIRTSSPLTQQLKRSTVEIIYQGSRWIVFARRHSAHSIAAPPGSITRVIHGA